MAACCTALFIRFPLPACPSMVSHGIPLTVSATEYYCTLTPWRPSPCGGLSPPPRTTAPPPLPIQAYGPLGPWRLRPPCHPFGSSPCSRSWTPPTSDRWRFPTIPSASCGSPPRCRVTQVHLRLPFPPQ